ncbi:MAG: membrane protein insertase YidC [Acidobacteriota bacterium]|jgi:YidC/Oxa1 family membrane protein insertase|nr:membrane protein insertase YidC [Acidobacteriota bacterium]
MMDKRFVLFIILTFLVFIGFQYLAPKNQTPVPPPPAAQTEYPAAAPADATPAPAAAENGAASGDENDGQSDTKAAAQKIVIDGGLYRAVIDNRGGVLTSWELKDYLTTRTGKNEQSRVFDMIAGASRNEGLYPGALMLQDDAATATANNEYYQVTIEGAESAAAEMLSPPVAVKLTLTRGDLQIEKTWRFDDDNYTASLSISATRAGKPLEGRFFLGEDIGPEAEHLVSSRNAGLKSVYFSGGKVRRESPPKDPQEPKRLEGDVRWAGIDVQYFSMVAIPKYPLPWFNIQTTHLRQTSIDGKEIERNLLKVMLPLNSGASGGEADYKLYIGPKKQENLRLPGSVDLSGVIDYGMFSILVYPLLAALRWIHQLAQNYGAAIIILTFVISLVLFPLRLKSMLSMRKMSAIQPKIKAIQDKYRQYKATDPRKREMNQEVMALYKEHGVNPMGGCLPLLIQMPLLIAFYSLLAYTIDLRHAPFIWWLQDLSVKDPYYVLPIAMGLTTFISQKLMPMSPTTDPTQAKVMMIMPIFLTFIFLNMSSGLNLYFFCSNVFQIALQKIAERWIPKAAPQVPVKAKSKKG